MGKREEDQGARLIRCGTGLLLGGMLALAVCCLFLLGCAAAVSGGLAGEELGYQFTIVGCVLGGRLGYIIFYDLPVYLADPSEILRFWNGGMSFHGAAIGLSLAFLYFGRTRKKRFIDIADFITPLIPPGLFFGRIGNFINGELWGKVTTAPWGVIFPHAGPYPRHPSQLYEAFLEGVVLFVLLMWFSARPRRRGQIAGLFAMGYGISRFCVEFVRMPDVQLGYLAMQWLTMGQLLSLPLIAIGCWLFFCEHRG